MGTSCSSTKRVQPQDVAEAVSVHIFTNPESSLGFDRATEGGWGGVGPEEEGGGGGRGAGGWQLGIVWWLPEQSLPTVPTPQ